MCLVLWQFQHAICDLLFVRLRGYLFNFTSIDKILLQCLCTSKSDWLLITSVKLKSSCRRDRGDTNIESIIAIKYCFLYKAGPVVY